MTHAEFEAISPELPAHADEVMAAHPCQPTPVAHVAAGATAPPGDIGNVADGTSKGSSR
jgi:hypothetical protein